jgi:signal transduction histidine kinase
VSPLTGARSGTQPHRGSLRTRLALVFTTGAAIVALAAVVFLYVVLDRALLSATDESLRAQASDLAALVQETGGNIPDQDQLAQVVDERCTVLDASPAAARGAAVLGPDEIRDSGRGAFLERNIPALGSDHRLWVQPVDVGGQHLHLIVGASLDQYGRTRGRLAVVLVIAGPLLVVIMGAAGWILAGAALRPVARMTEEADAISIGDLDRRLDVPTANDEIANLGRTLNAMLDRIEESVAHERRFLDDASHELRTPLSILRGELELVLTHPHEPDEMIAAVRSAMEEAERLSRLANDLLALARARTIPAQPSLEEVDVRDEAARVCDLLRRAGGPQLVCTGTGGLLQGDRDRIGQVLINLVSNAQRFASSRVEVRTDEHEDRVEVLIADDGPGFAAELLPLDYARFARADTQRARDTGSSGLGLAIVAGLVRGQGGTIDAGNGEPLGGAWVRVVWPRRLGTVPPPVGRRRSAREPT